MLKNDSNYSSSSDNEGSSQMEKDTSEEPTHKQTKTQTSLLSFGIRDTRKRPCGNDDLNDTDSSTSSGETSNNNEMVLKELDISEEERLKREECRALDALISVKEKQLEDLKA